MIPTATRLGSAPITLDWSNLTSVPTSRAGGAGQTDTSAAASATAFNDAWNKLKARFDSDEVGFYYAPTSNQLSQATETTQLAQRILDSKRFKDCLFLGIGGSALGPISFLSSLSEKCRTGLRFHFCENPDPIDWRATLATLEPESTLVCVVTKSGTTFETVAQMLLALEWLGKPRWKSHVVAITDPAKGDLRKFADENEIPTLSIAPSMGGRFSVFTPVGLFPAALAGLSITEFLKGAQQVREYLDRTPLERNPLMILGNEMIQQFPKRSVHVCMPYSTRLRSIGLWFVQLWGESLGKDGKGFTPLAAVGATDQHSILQLLRDGPDDKITMFITVDQIEDPVKIPRAPLTRSSGQFASFSLIEGHTLQELLMTEYQATSRVLTRQSRPNLTLKLDQLDERALGALYFAFSALTAFTGTLWGVNPFDQPGVEEGKIYTRESLNAQKANADQQESDENSAVRRLRPDRS